MTAEEIANGALRITWWETESQARRVAEHAEDLIAAARKQALEEAAKVCDELSAERAKDSLYYGEEYGAADAATKIRALASQ